ncbi:MAG: NAD-dependent protein deacetylase [Burkholderiales bacterium]|nr:MAG: NAD-dependent protein deacetylase [Burkholderiales bacterium]
MDALSRLVDFVARHAPLFVLTGAGVSTESGIPDYRDTNGEWKRPQPVTYQAFMGEDYTRRRYWARSMVGWQIMGTARPGPAHAALAAMESQGLIGMLLTQNVDGLHNMAGSRHVIDLHGRIDTVRCMGCEKRTPRAVLQLELLQRNPLWADLKASTAPDGDADLESRNFASFDIPSCPVCGGILKPDVVFFGENVPRDRLADARAALARSPGVLVAGSSLMVYSGFRFVQEAVDAGKPVAAVNIGRMRADPLLTLKVELPVGETLSALVAAMSPGIVD